MQPIVFLKDVILYVRIACFVVALPFLLRVKSLSSILNLSMPILVRSCLHCPQREQIKKIVRFTDFLLSWRIPVFRYTCLKRSLILFKFLREIGLPIEINFGVYKGKLTSILKKRGHVWLTLKGKFFFAHEPFREKYTLSYTFPEIEQAKK